MRRSRKLSWKKGGVDCELSRRERDFPNAFGVVIVRSSLYRNPRSLLLDGNKLSLQNQKDSVRGDLGEDVRRMADLLKSGATMLSDICPECGTPLFKVKGETFCAKCNRPVVYTKATTVQGDVTLSPSHLLDSVEQTIVKKINDANEILKNEKQPEKLSAYSNLLFGWLSTLEKLRSLKETFKE